MRKISRLLLFILALSASLFGQGGAVNQVLGPPPQAWVQLFYYSGSNVSYICMAPASTNPTYFTISGTPGLTSITVSSNTATINLPATAYFWGGQLVTISGSTTTALNGTYKLLTVSGMTATFTSSGVSDGTYNNAALTVSTTHPLLNAALWSVEVFTYASSNVTGIYWGGAVPTGGTVPQNLKCSNGANY